MSQSRAFREATPKSAIAAAPMPSQVRVFIRTPPRCFGLRCAQADAPSRLTPEPGTCPKGAGGRVLREGWKPDGRDRSAGSVRSTTARRRRSRRSPRLMANDIGGSNWNVMHLSTSSTNASDLWRTRRVGGWDKPESRGPMAPCLDRAPGSGAWRARHLSRVTSGLLEATVALRRKNCVDDFARSAQGCTAPESKSSARRLEPAANKNPAPVSCR